MSAFLLTQCERPAVVVVEVLGIQPPNIERDKPLNRNPTVVYRTAKELAETIDPTIGEGISVASYTQKFEHPITGQTLNSQMEEFAETLGHDVGTNVKDIKGFLQQRERFVSLDEQEIQKPDQIQVLKNLGLVGVLVSLGFKDLVVNLDGQEEKRQTINFDREAPDTNGLRFAITRRSGWSEGDVSRVTCEYDSVTTNSVTLVLRNKGTSPITCRYGITTMYEVK